jgi:hypothetical protein
MWENPFINLRESSFNTDTIIWKSGLFYRFWWKFSTPNLKKIYVIYQSEGERWFGHKEFFCLLCNDHLKRRLTIHQHPKHTHRQCLADYRKVSDFTHYFKLEWKNRGLATNPTPWSRALLAKIIFIQLLRKFLEFYGIPWYATVFARRDHLWPTHKYTSF